MKLTDDAPLASKLSRWEISPPSPDLYEKIVAQAQQHKQRIPWLRKATESLKYSFSDWHTEMSYKFASLLLCAVLGFASGAYQRYEGWSPTSAATVENSSQFVAASQTQQQTAQNQTDEDASEDLAATDVEHLFDDIFQGLEGSLL